MEDSIDSKASTPMRSADIYSTKMSRGESSMSGFSQHSDRLDYSQSLLGREEYLQRLHEIYEFVQNRGGSSLENKEEMKTKYPSTVMIRGLPGTGKSTLVRQFIEDLERKSKESWGTINPLFLHGKFDDRSDDPYSALIEAFRGFADTLVKQGKDELIRVRRAIKKALGGETYYLTTVIPDLKKVTGDGIVVDDTVVDREYAANRLKYVFQKFTNAIGTRERPVILLMDDLQWCDAASADLIEALLTDNDRRYMMFIGIYQSNEMGPGSAFYESLQTIEKIQPVLNIDMSNLSYEEMGLFIAEVLNVTTIEAESLTQMIYGKTKGNIFFARQVLDLLHRVGVLNYDSTEERWEWFLDGIDIESMLSGDVNQVVTAKLRRIPGKLQRALIVAAYTRATIDSHTLQKLLELDSNPINSNTLLKMLDNAVLEGYLMNSMGSDSYSFTNDSIQQAAYNLLPVGDARDNFRFKLGRWLYEMTSSTDGEDWMFFAAADHLNATARDRLKDPLFLIKLNKEAGDRAASRAAFQTAAKYLGFALQDILRLDDPWESHYDTTLQVYQAIVDVKLCQGHFSVGKTIGEEVLVKAKSSDDKLPVQLALSKALGREEKHKESFEMSVGTLQRLKEFPRGALSIHGSLIKDLFYVRRYFWKKKSDDDFLRLPLMKDERKEAIAALLHTTSYQAFMCGNMVGFLVGTLKMIRLTIQYGLCGQSGVALTGYCLFSNNINDMATAMRFANLAQKVLTLTKAKHLESVQLFVVAHWIKGWKDPQKKVLATFDHATKSAMETGDFENGLLNTTASLYFEFVSGNQLKPLSHKYSNLVEKLKGYKIDSVLGMTYEQWRVIQHLTGKARSAYTATVKDVKDVVTDNEKYRLVFGYLARLQLGVYFGNYGFAEKMAEKLAAIADFDKSYVVNSLRLFFSSLTYTTLARRYKKRSYESKARKYCNQLMTMCKIKGSNSWHRCMLMEAHLKSLGGKRVSSVQSSYDYAIELALKSGHKHDAGLAAQLAAEHFLSIRDDELNSHVLAKARDHLVRNYLTEARDLFSDWGASALVKHLEKTYDSFLEPISTYVDDSSQVIERNGKIESSRLLSSEYTLSKQVESQNDDVSIMTDTDTEAAWKHVKSFSNPHTDSGDYPALIGS